MIRNWFCLLLVAYCLVCSAKELPLAVKTSDCLNMDGRLDEPAWQNALAFLEFFRHKTHTPGFPASARLLFDDDHLYIGFHCPFPPGKNALVHGLANIWIEDHVEVMVDANRTGDRYYHFAVNVDGKVFSSRRGQGGIVRENVIIKGASAGVFHGSDFWSTEIKIPLAILDIGVEGNTWGFNFAYGIRQPDEDASIIPGGVFHNAAAFLPVGGFKVGAAERFAWSLDLLAAEGTPAPEGMLQVAGKVALTNRSPKPRTCKVDFQIADRLSTAVNVTLQPGERQEVNCPPIVISPEQAGSARISILDAQTRQPLCWRDQLTQIAIRNLEVRVVAPHYNNTIFASQKLDEVILQLHSRVYGAAEFLVSIRNMAGVILQEKKLQSPEKVAFPASALPEERMQVVAEAFDAKGQRLDISTVPLRKLSYRPGEVWRDEQGFWRRDQQRIWLIAEWGDGTTPNLNAAFYKREGLLYVDPLHAWEYPERTKIRNSGRIDAEAEALIRSHTARKMFNPDLFAWFIVDEPDCKGFTPDFLKQFCQVLRDEDPWHPQVIGTYSRGLEYFGTAEINMMHAYPSVDKKRHRANFGKVVSYLDDFKAAAARNPEAPSLMYFTPGYNNGDCGSKNSRIYHFDETRTENLMAITMGSRGSLFYVWTAAQYPESYIGHAEWSKELRVLEPVLLADDAKTDDMKVDNPNIRFQVKKVGTEIWLFAFGASANEEKANFVIPELGGRSLQVFREDRTISVEDGRFSDTFTNFDARIYSTDMRTFALRSLAEVESEIAAVHRQRRKVGNLAYQRYEEDSLTVTASSNRFASSRNANNCLWHVTDGLTTGIPAVRAHGKAGVLTWWDKTPGQLPDWLEITFRQDVNVGRAVVYPANQSLRDYQLQVWADNAWQCVGKVHDAQGKRQEITFPSIQTQRVRLVVTANNGPDTILHEIELYEK
jgi:hypothetical protein